MAACTLSVGAFARGGGHSGGGHHSGSSYHSGGGHVNPNNHRVSSYTKKNGTYVAPSHATNHNGTKTDNYTHKGNVNPYTGKTGTKN